MPLSDVASALQPVINSVSKYHNVSFTIALVTDAGNMTVFAGDDDRLAPAGTSRMRASGRFPMGSVTKSWTSMRVMQLHEEGVLDIDRPIAPYVDDVLRRFNGTSMSELWSGDPKIVNVTARRLMGMRAGLHDYNDTWYSEWTWAHPDGDLDPFDVLWALDKSWQCEPGACAAYASPGYVLLGLMLCQAANCSTWEALDQRAVLRGGMRERYQGVAFPMRGPCSADPSIVHQYRPEVVNGSDGVVATHVDIVDYSCLNTWTAGNIAATVSDVAQWWWDIFHHRVVNSSTLVEMLNGVPLSQGWNPGLYYGLGLMHTDMASWGNKGADAQNLTWTLGHGGADYGSIAQVEGFNPIFNFSISLGANSVMGANCSEEYRARYPVYAGMMYQDSFYFDAACVVYDAVLQALTGAAVPRLNCTATANTRRRLHHGSATSNYSCEWRRR